MVKDQASNLLGLPDRHVSLHPKHPKQVLSKVPLLGEQPSHTWHFPIQTDEDVQKAMIPCKHTPHIHSRSSVKQGVGNDDDENVVVSFFGFYHSVLRYSWHHNAAYLKMKILFGLFT